MTTNNPRIKIPVHNLRPGMFIVELDRPWLDTPFLFHRKKINKQEQIDKLIAHGIKEVTIDTEKGVDIERESYLSEEAGGHKEEETVAYLATVTIPQDSDPVELTEELPQARKIKSEVTQIIKDVFEDIRMGKSIELPAVKQKVAEIVESVFRNRNALCSLAHLKEYDEYTFAHSVNVSVLVTSFGRHLGMPKKHLESIALGGLLHDLGKTQVPDSILNKHGRYTDEEYNIMKRHVNLGAEILEQYEDIPHEAKLITLLHHERYNGTGYPQRLSGDKISLVGQIASIADVYDAMTSERVYRPVIRPHLILKRLYEWADTLFDRTLIERFIQCIGIYPYGSFVKLNRDYYGVVISQNNRTLLRPTVLLLFQGDKKLPHTLIDLSKERDRDGKYTYYIEETLDPASRGIDINQALSTTT